MVLSHYKRILAGAIVTAFILLSTGCKKGAEAFFSGRPSGMSMVHNRIISRAQEGIPELLKVPSRFPDATMDHCLLWQHSLTAWWAHPDKKALMIQSARNLTAVERAELRDWVKKKPRNQTAAQGATLLEVESALNARSKADLSSENGLQ